MLGSRKSLPLKGRISNVYTRLSIPTPGTNYYSLIGLDTEEQKAEFRNNPASLTKYRKEIEHAFNKFFYALITDSPENKYMTAEYSKIMKRRLGGDEELAEEFIPKWSVGCRRLTPGEGYLEALQEKNCSHTWSPIVKITENGILTEDGKEHELDAIVCATGFDVCYVPQWKMQGYGGKTLESWRQDPLSYLGIHAPNMPNYFIVNGPNCPIGHGSLLAVMEWSSEYILKWVVKLATEEIKYVSSLSFPFPDMEPS